MDILIILWVCSFALAAIFVIIFASLYFREKTSKAKLKKQNDSDGSLSQISTTSSDSGNQVLLDDKHGKVRVKLTYDETGSMLSVTILEVELPAPEPKPQIKLYLKPWSKPQFKTTSKFVLQNSKQSSNETFLFKVKKEDLRKQALIMEAYIGPDEGDVSCCGQISLPLSSKDILDSYLETSTPFLEPPKNNKEEGTQKN